PVVADLRGPPLREPVAARGDPRLGAGGLRLLRRRLGDDLARRRELPGILAVEGLDALGDLQVVAREVAAAAQVLESLEVAFEVGGGEGAAAADGGDAVPGGAAG